MATAPKDAGTDVVEAEVVEDDNETRSRGVSDVSSAIAGLNNSEAAFYSSVKGDNFEARKIIARAQTASTPIADALGETIVLSNFIIQAVKLQDDTTGEVEEAPRVTLIGEDGRAFHATSTGLLTALKNIITTLGEPHTWPEGLPLKVVEKRGRAGYRYMTIELV